MSTIGIIIAWEPEADNSYTANVGNYRLSVMAGGRGFSWYVDHLFPYQGGDGLAGLTRGGDFITYTSAQAAAEAALVRILHSPRRKSHR